MSSVLNWAIPRREVISHSRSILPWALFAKAQSPMDVLLGALLSTDMIRLEMFVQGTQIQIKCDTYLARLYLNVSLLSPRDTVTLPPPIVNAE